MSLADWSHFIKLVRTHTARHVPNARVDEEQGAVISGEQQFGLQNLAQVCAGQPIDDWTTIVAEHFKRLVQASPGDALTPDELTAVLKVKVYPNDGGYEFVRGPKWPLGEGMFACLAADLPTSVKTLSDEELDSLSMGHDEAFQLGLDHVWDEGRLTHEVVKLPQGELGILAGDSLFSATHVFFLESYCDSIGELGAFVCIPNRHSILYHRITSEGSLTLGAHLLNLAASGYEQGPGSISRELFWWDAGRLVHIPVVFDGEIGELSPPEEFITRVAVKLL